MDYYIPRVPEREPLAGRVALNFILDGYTPEHARERVVPDGQLYLILELDGRERYVFDDEGEVTVRCRRAWLSGVHENYFTIGDTRPGSILAVTQFAFGRARPFLHVDIESLNDRILPAVEVLGPSVLELRERLLTGIDPQQRLDAIEAYWSERYDPEAEPSETVVTAARSWAEDPDVEIGAWAEAHGISTKHLVTLFKRHVGPTPKRFLRIRRFCRIFEALQQQQAVHWSELALDLGYTDQSHLIREFVAFSGYRPQAFVKQEHDRTNFFPEEER